MSEVITLTNPPPARKSTVEIIAITGTDALPNDSHLWRILVSRMHLASGAVPYHPMQLNRFDLNLLIALDALLQERSVTRAAERAFVSQPAMSAALQKLREFFNDQLLVRVGRDMELTPRGLSLLGPVREAILRIQATLGTQPGFDPATAKRAFTIGFSADTLIHLIPAVFRQIAREAPGLECHVQELSEATFSRLEYGDVDLYVGLISPQLFRTRAYPDTFRMVDLKPVRWVCAVARDHPTVADELTKEQYLALPHLCSWPNSEITPLREQLLQLLGDNINVRATARGLLEIPFLLAGTPMVAILPERLATALATIAGIKLLPPPVNFPETREVVLWHKRNEADPSHAWLREVIIELGRRS